MTDRDPGRVPLTFETDRGASRAFWIAMLILLLVCAWMASGYFVAKPEPEPVAAAEILPPLVLVRNSRAEPVTLTFRAEGQAQPDRDTAIRVQTSGTVAEVAARKGMDVQAGAVIARLSSDTADATLQQAREALSRAQREFDNASQLKDRGVATSDRVSDARAALASAEAQVTAAEVALDDLVVTAPFTGRIETLPINDGEFVAAGEEVARLVDNDPLTVTIQVPQQSLNRIKTGQSAMVQFITGHKREGRVSFVGTAAEAATRTFLAEIEIANEGGEIPAGISAQIAIPTGQELAHFIEPSIVSLDPDGDVGVKIVEGEKVRFVPVEVADAQQGGVWVTGLPEKARIVTIGQGFVRDGENVRVQDETDRADEIAPGGAVDKGDGTTAETGVGDTSAITSAQATDAGGSPQMQGAGQ